MALRKRILGITGLIVIALILSLYFISHTIVLNSFSELEEQHVEQNVERARSAIQDDISDIDTMTYDWAAWDDTYTFIENKNEEYIKSNLVDETFTGSRLNLILYIDREGSIVYGKMYDLVNRMEVPIPESLKKMVKNPFFQHNRVDSSLKGIIILPEGPMLIASRPILTSDEKGPIRGSILMGRYLDDAEVEHLSEATHVPISIYRLNDPEKPQDFEDALSELCEQQIFVQSVNEKSVAGYTFLNDISGKPALIVKIEMPRDI